jgi:hypothetical protein
VWNELVPLLNTDQLLEVVEEGGAFLVGNAGEGIIGILTLKIRDQLGVFVVFTKLGDAVRQGFPADESAEIADPLVVVNSSLDTSLQVDSPAFVEPEVLPAGAALQKNVSAYAQSYRIRSSRSFLQARSFHGGSSGVFVTYCMIVSDYSCMISQPCPGSGRNGNLTGIKYGVLKLTNKVTRPRVCQLVSNNINVSSVSADQSGRCESEDGVFHSTVPC